MSLKRRPATRSSVVLGFLGRVTWCQRQGPSKYAWSTRLKLGNSLRVSPSWRVKGRRCGQMVLFRAVATWRPGLPFRVPPLSQVRQPMSNPGHAWLFDNCFLGSQNRTVCGCYSSNTRRIVSSTSSSINEGRRDPPLSLSPSLSTPATSTPRTRVLGSYVLWSNTRSPCKRQATPRAG